MSIGNGIAYPCTPTPSKCPPTPVVNSTNFVFTGTATGTITHGPNKLKTGLESGIWDLTTSGIYAGSCGLSSGFLGGFLVPRTVGIGSSKSKSRSLTGSFLELAGVTVGTGTTSKGETLNMTYYTILISGSCLDKGPKTFLVAGSMTITRVP